ncbi:helix-turn-helix transcriptional regulator [Sphingomonas oligophenolica]|uniref:YafY family transcriptional regulator n=1 Tax=Sphingomonas oligophenolica TaxID=301154 RepID=A0A502CHE8_9SPHN|nr:YafY family protein [Sphingomonas oligophenolica]TPG12024.1 YafY family transcriptional regulator [Sphingomonas oligophenolica]
MRRADRLFQIVQYLRGGRLVTARALAERLEVSDRTIYRDIADLQSTGVPIDGEAGVGYIMRSGYDLPPLMFTREEIVALVTGIRMVKSWGGMDMARAAAEALVKIELVLPEAERARVANANVFAPPMELTDEVRALIDVVETAIESRAILRFGYADRQGATTERRVHPLGLWFWGKVWTLVAWCEMRHDFRMFRLDRTTGMAITGEQFRPAAARSLAECLRQYEERYGPQD